MKYFAFHVYWFEYLTELNYINISIILQRLVVVFKILYLNPIQGCIINRMCTTVDVEALNDYQSNYFNYSIIGKFWCTRYVWGSFKLFFVCNWIFEELYKNKCFLYLHAQYTKNEDNYRRADGKFILFSLLIYFSQRKMWTNW